MSLVYSVQLKTRTLRRETEPLHGTLRKASYEMTFPVSCSLPDKEKRLTPALRGVLAETATTGTIRYHIQAASCSSGLES